MHTVEEFERPKERWYAVRCIFEWRDIDESLRSDGVFRHGSHIYEERITIWEADSSEEAIELAEQAAEEYTTYPGDPEYLGIAQVYHLMIIESPDSGVEVFSLCRGSELSPEEYIAQFFSTGDEYQQIL